MKVAIINSTNYEAWLLDFVEGRLSSSEVVLLRAFAQSHPELDIDLEDLDLFYLESDTEQAFDVKADLKKAEISLETADQILLEAIEDDTQLDKAERLLLDYPALELDFKAYKKTKLIPDLGITFTDKIGLKKSLVLDEATELKLFEATELVPSSEAHINSFINTKSGFEKEIKAYQLARFSADKSIVYPNKKSLKKTMFLGMEQKTLYRIAALLIGISFLGTYLFTNYQNPNNNTAVAKNDTKPVPSEKANPIVVPMPKSADAKQLAAINKKVIPSVAKKANVNKSKSNALPIEVHKALPQTPPVQEEINLAEHKTIQLDNGITVQPISAEDPIVIALENTNTIKKVNPTIVLEDKEEEITSTETETKDPLLYTAANKVNRVLGLITNKKIPVSKKQDKDKVSYAIGKDLLSYSTNKKMQP